jgi:hypothetical protein
MENNKYDLSEFAYSKSVLKDFPKLISLYREILPILTAYSHYTIAYDVREVVLDSLSLAEIQYDYYEVINEKKGKI